MNDKGARLKRQGYLSWDLVDGLAVVVDEAEGKVFNFNQVGTEIWKSLDGQKSEVEIVAAVTSIFDEKESKIKKEVGKFIKELRRMDLIEASS